MHNLQLFLFLFCCFCSLSFFVESKTSLISEACPNQDEDPITTVRIGVVIDQTSRLGREQKIAMELAVHDFHHCRNLVLHLKDSHGNSARAASAAIDLLAQEKVDVIIGTITLQEVLLLSELKTLPINILIISLSPATLSPQQSPRTFANFIQISTPITYRMQCIAAIVSRFRWRKVILIHEQTNGFSEDSAYLSTQLSDSLRIIDSSIDHHLSVPKALIEEKLKKLRSKNVKIFIVAQCSVEFAVILFEKAKELGMMEKGHVWIVSDAIANFLDSVDLSVIFNMQGVIGLKTDYAETGDYYREFKSRFRRKYGSEYPEEEENSSPSLYSLLAYDAVWSLAKQSSNFEGLSGRISFKNGLLTRKPIFRIINVIGKSYREVALWSTDYGLSENLIQLNGKSSIYWPGGDQIVPIGWTLGDEGKPLRIGVPAKSAFNQFVKVTYDPGLNLTWISGFSIDVFEAAVKQLPYALHYVLVPHYGSYDDMVAEVHNKSLDAAVGDTEIMADRYVYAEFSQPYIESGLVMVVTVKSVLKESRFIALNAFTKKMWIQLGGVSLSTGAIIWLSEYATGNEQFTRNSFLELIGSILWLSVTIISFSQRENIKNSASKLVLAAWICVVFVVGACFTAVLSSMMTVPRLQPSVVDINYLRNTNAVVGCNGNSFIVQYLINVLRFKPENVRKIDFIQDYPKAFESGNIKAAFFVAPHAKVFLAEYCKGYTISGPSFKLGGFGFVFPKGSPLAIDISQAILKVTQNGEVNALEKNMLYHTNCTSSNSREEETEDIKLGPEPFSGLFQVLGCAIGFAFFIAIVRLIRMKWSNGCDLIQKVLIMKRTCTWASLVMSE
ncbi:Glutamate-gated kainate-type ion channel receptor subunit GluR5 [Handroanthus impetiginosus]|uniref:Glutamate receptor n=1 Tax=Handroanthus impetiginosus TaxID=429701 RepID=A0A2G9HG27_9LAMI|nr:Glutamate-gated kainate-type ion channel receptor subunit GluR5 [Handroanthus impetiginosus]